MPNLLGAYLEQNYPEVSALEFYRDLFPQGLLDERGKLTKGKYAGVAVCVDKDNKAKRYSICDDLEPLPELLKSDDFVIISPVSYAGRAPKQVYARQLFAICFDVDGIRIGEDSYPAGLVDLLHQMKSKHDYLPLATYIVSSGTGIHVYYFLDKPIRLYAQTMKQLFSLRAELTRKIWNRYVTTLSRNPQYESVTQGFRAVSSVCKDGKQRVRAFKIGERISIDYLNKYVSDENRVKQTKDSSKLAEAKKKYPEWYERRVIQGQPKGTWTTKPDLYYWWLRKIHEGATVGHRYFCVMALAVYARKAGIPKEQLEKDALALIPLLDDMTEDENNHFTADDVLSALQAYKARYITFPREVIEKLTAIEIPANKRNYRKQDIHMKTMRAIRDVLYPNGEWDNKGGAPTKKDLVFDYLEKHPKATAREIAKALGINKDTACKWARAWREDKAKPTEIEFD